MSAVYGMVRHGGHHVAAETWAAFRAAIAYWPADAAGQWVGGPAALGHLAAWTTPEAALCDQPCAWRQGEEHRVVTADARLDNRDDLYRALRDHPTLQGRPLGAIADCELLLAAHLTWGDAAPARLLGDFAYAIWDARRAELLCVRDPLGIKPFYYQASATGFVFANDLRGLVGSGLVAPALDRSALGLFLLDGELLDAERCFYQGVRKLPPGGTLKVTNSGIERRVYWRPEDSPAVRFRAPADYVARLVDLLQDAVAVRLRSGRAVASQLSGGLDSGLVTALAARALGSRGQPLRCYNWVPPPAQGDAAEQQEWANSATIAWREELALDFVDLAPADVLRQLSALDLAEHGTADCWYETPWRRRATEAGIGVILSGWGGDELISYGGRLSFTDAASRGHLVAALRGLWSEARAQPRWPRRWAGGIRREIVLPLLRRAPRAAAGFASFACARPEFAAAARQLVSHRYDLGALRVRDEQLGLLAQGHLQNRSESWANAGRADRIEYRFPLLDRRLVEFALGLPPACYRQQGQSRFLFREAARGWLPEPVRLVSAKQEPRRVQRLLEAFETALPAWLEQVRSQPGLWARYGANELIDRAKVAARIVALGGASGNATRARIAEVSLLMKSVQVLNAGWRRAGPDSPA